MYILNENGSVTVWDTENQQWVRIYSLSTNVSRYIPEEAMEEIAKHFERHCWNDKARGNE
jgi:hypothetical protein